MSKRFAFLSTTKHTNVDLGLLIIRVVTAGTLVLKHGWEKAFDFHTMLTNTKLPFPDPFHMGVFTSLTIALISDFYCGLFVVLGLGTRFAAAYSFVCISVAWVTVHHFSYFGPRADHGEIIILMLGTLAGLVISGPGRYSLDYLLADRKSEQGAASESIRTGAANPSIDDGYEPRAL
jgi:putative oxidoreductase